MIIKEVKIKTLWEWLMEIFWSPGIENPKTRRFWIQGIKKMTLENGMKMVTNLMDADELPKMAHEHPEHPGIYAITVSIHSLEDDGMDILYTYGDMK